MNKKNEKFINFKKNHLKKESKNWKVKPISNSIKDENYLKFNSFGFTKESGNNNKRINNFNLRNSNNMIGSFSNPKSGTGKMNPSKIVTSNSRSTNEEFRKLREGFSFGRLQYLNKNPQRDGVINNKLKLGGVNTRTKKTISDGFIYNSKKISSNEFIYEDNNKFPSNKNNELTNIYEDFNFVSHNFNYNNNQLNNHDNNNDNNLSNDFNYDETENEIKNSNDEKKYNFNY